MKLCALIAAAGQSSRMGFHKALLKIDDQLVIISLANKLNNNTTKKIFVTLPDELLFDLNLKEKLAFFNINIRANKYLNHKYSGSVKTIILEVKNYFDGIIICPIDSPFLPKSVFDIMQDLAKLYYTKPSIILPCFGHGPGHPVFFSKHFFGYLQRAHKYQGLRGLIKIHEKFVHRFYFHDTQILANINTTKDLLLWQQIHTHIKANTII